MTSALIASALMVGSTSTTFSDKLTFRRAYLLYARHLHKHNQAGRKEKLRRSDGVRERSSKQNGRHKWGVVGRSWIAGRGLMTGRMAGRRLMVGRMMGRKLMAGRMTGRS